jgi:hypothetical protein
MLDYAMTILSKVSFSSELFSKELRKCINWVEKEKLQDLKKWCYSNYGEIYHDILDNAFSGKAA